MSANEESVEWTVAKFLLAGVAVIGMAAGLFIFVAAPGTGDVGKLSMAVWGIGLLLVTQNLISFSVLRSI